MKVCRIALLGVLCAILACLYHLLTPIVPCIAPNFVVCLPLILYEHVALSVRYLKPSDLHGSRVLNGYSVLGSRERGQVLAAVESTDFAVLGRFL